MMLVLVLSSSLPAFQAILSSNRHGLIQPAQKVPHEAIAISTVAEQQTEG